MNNIESIISILEWRGFLIEKKENDYYLSDNADLDSDNCFLNDLIKNNSFGNVDVNRKININN